MCVHWRFNNKKERRMDLVHLGGSVCLVSAASMLFIYFVGSIHELATGAAATH